VVRDLEGEKVSPEIDVVLAMLDLVCEAQEDRRGKAGAAGPGQILQEVAESVVPYDLEVGCLS
jgi:hypothetical protein